MDRRSPTPTRRRPTSRAAQRYVTPERRELQQIMFQNADEARAAAERLDTGD